MKYVQHIAHMREKDAYSNLVGKPEGKRSRKTSIYMYVGIIYLHGS
jgi:hypothetical protein